MATNAKPKRKEIVGTTIQSVGMGYTLESARKSVGPGWQVLVDVLWFAVRYEFKKRDIKILQIKEKFGGLRFYVSGTFPELSHLVDQMEYLSEKTCECCGRPGVPRPGGWIKTLCEECDKNRNNRNWRTWKYPFKP